MAAPLLSVHGISKAYSHGPLIEDLTLTVHEGERLGLIGDNGAGKSTLLKILAGLETPDEGNRVVSASARVAYVPQEDSFPEKTSVLDVVLHSLAGEALEEVECLTRAQIQLSKVGFEDLEQHAAALSGGWRKRLALARALSSDPDLLLLDEPTNHLDIAGIEWLEGLLRSAPFAWLMVTHDRFVLERVTTHVIEIGKSYPDGYFKVEGSYSRFLERRDAFLLAQSRQEESLRNKVRQEVAFLRSNVREQRTKSKHLVEKAYAAIDELKTVQARTAGGKSADIEFTATGRKTKKLITAIGVGKSLGGNLLFSGIDLELGPGDRLGLVGDNGSGKTTLLKILSGQLEPDSGSVGRAKGLRVVTFSQHRLDLDPELTLQETLARESDMIRFRGKSMHVSGWAKRFGFSPQQLQTKVGALSGGERARVLIADLVRQDADLLLLDEPTNDLDLATREVLEESLLQFAGALILVTHDRYMLDRVSTMVLGLHGGRARIVADYHQWERARKAARKAEAQAKSQARAKSKAPSEPSAAAPMKKRKLSYKEQREFDSIEETIMGAEEELDALKQKVEDPAVMADHTQISEAYERLHAAQDRVDALYARWQELEAITQGGS